MKDKKVIGVLTDIGTEELAHLEIVGSIIHQLTKDLTPDEIKASGFDKYYIYHTLAVWPQSAGGEPFSASQFQSTGDTITDLYEDMAAEHRRPYHNAAEPKSKWSGGFFLEKSRWIGGIFQGTCNYSVILLKVPRAII